MIVACNLNKKFGKVTSLKNLDLHVKKGTIHGLIGPESSGKTTVLQILSTLIRPDSGDVTINNIPIDNGSKIREMIGYVPKTPHLPEEYTARGLMTFSASLYGISDENMINRMLKVMGLEAVADQTLDRYSENMKKNFAIANALIHDPEILLFDEPMAGLDPVSQKRLQDILKDLNKTVLITGQDLNAVDGICSRVTVLKNGSVIVDDELAALRQEIGKGALEIKLQDAGLIQKLIFELEKNRLKVSVSGESVFVTYNDESEVPGIIRIAANASDINKVRPIKISVDDIFSRFKVSK